MATGVERIAAVLAEINQDPVAGNQALLELATDAQFPETLREILTTPDIDQTVQRAAAIHLRHYLCAAALEADAPMVGHWLQIVIEAPPFAQLHMQPVLREIIRIAVQLDLITEILDGAEQQLCANPFISVLLFRNCLKEICPHHGHRELCERSVRVIPQILAVLRDHFSDHVLLHVVLHFLNTIYSKYCGLEAHPDLGPLIVGAMGVPRVEKDACKLAVTLFEVCQSWSPEQAINVFWAMCGHIRSGHSSYKATVQVFRFARQGLCACPEFVGAIEESVGDLIAEIVFPLFVLREDERRMVEDGDLFGFLGIRDPVMYEATTPISSAIMFLSYSHRVGWTRRVVEVAINELAAPQELARVYGAVAMAGYALEVDEEIPEELFRALVTPMRQIIERVPDDQFIKSAFLMLLSHIQATLECLFFAFDMLFSDSPLVVYSAAAAIANLLESFEKDAIAKDNHIRTDPNRAIGDVWNVLFEINRALPTDSMAKAVHVFVKVFLQELLPAAKSVIPLLFQLFGELFLDDNTEFQIQQCNKIRAAIHQLLDAVDDAEFFDVALVSCLSLTQMAEQPEELPVIFSKLQRFLIDIFTRSPELTPPFFEFIATTPNIAETILSSGDWACFQDLVEVLCIAVRRAPEWIATDCAAQIGAVVEAVLTVIREGPLEETEMYLVLPAVKLIQVIFVSLGESEFTAQLFPCVLERVTELNRTSLADALAALMSVETAEPLVNECNLRIWLQHASPLPFLHSAAVLFAAWDAAPPQVQAAHEAIVARMAEFVAVLTDADQESWESGQADWLFDMEGLLQRVSEYLTDSQWPRRLE
jgi:hypothetical protein